MRMALDCARSVYEAVDRRMPEAAALANWLRQSAAAFGLPDTAIPDDDTPRRSRRRGVPALDWRKIGSALTSAEEALSDNANTPADHWIEAIAGTLALDPLEARMLALALHYKLDQRVAQEPLRSLFQGARRSGRPVSAAAPNSMEPGVTSSSF